MNRYIVLLIPCIVLFLTAASCNTESSQPPKLSISPGTVSLKAGASATTFKAALANISGEVSWTLEPNLGTLSSTTGLEVTYTPPATMAEVTTVTLTASLGNLTAKSTLTISPVATTGDTPIVLSVDPPDGATGVTSDAIITITFSKAMNTEATQAAYESSDLLPSDVDFFWNDEATVLEIEGKNFLEYARGEGTTFPAKQYVFGITAAAKDIDGNSLEPFSSSFSTLRAISNSCLGMLDLEGQVQSNNAIALNGSVIEVGDSSDSSSIRGFFSFDLSPCLPPDGQPVSYAELNLYKFVTDGNPQELGFLTPEHLDFGDSLTIDDYAIPAFASVGITDIGSVPDRTWMTWPVTTYVQDDIANRDTRGERSQFRLRFDVETNNNNAFDVITFIATTSAGGSFEPFISLEYLIP
jgi:hypothetical protein